MKVLLLLAFIMAVKCENYYEFLGVSQGSTDREIRQAFKKKALLLHPDKNKDPNAHTDFLKLNKIYEVLKDAKLRQKYDNFGEEGLEEKSQHSTYHSWSYYRDNFGIYDDDYPDIVTLTQSDFEQLSSSSVWFINYYSPMCSHCHTLAPIWRKLAKKLYGVVRFGAVNCEDSFMLCRTESLVSGFPSLILYPNHLKYQGSRTLEDLFSFVMNKLDQEPDYELTENNFRKTLTECLKPWLVIDRGDKDFSDFVTYRTQLKSIFKNLVCLGELDCEFDHKLCHQLGFPGEPKFYADSTALSNATGVKVRGADIQEFSQNFLSLLPTIPEVSVAEYLELRNELVKNEKSKPLLLIFVSHEELDFDMKKLPTLLSSVMVRQISCVKYQEQCNELFISKTPSFVLFKPGSGYEVHQGRNMAEDIAAFASEAVLATKFQTFTPTEFHSAISSGGTVMVDFFAPWCPPCMKLLPNFKKASRLLELNVKFGSIDCTIHSKLCTQYNIRQYPTLILYNQSVPHLMRGQHSASQIVEFVVDTLAPSVIVLDENSFYEKIYQKKHGETWVVDYFANWCGPCLDMAPEYRKFARTLKDTPNIYVATIDCATHHSICQQQKIRSYPSIVMYPSGSNGIDSPIQFNEWNRDAESFKYWLFSNLPSAVENLDDETFETMLRSEEPSLIYFYLPNCRPCISYSPVYDEIASVLEDDIFLGKINCNKFHWICRAAGVQQYPTVQYYKGITNGRQSPVGIELWDIEMNEVLNFVKRQKRTTQKHDEL